MAVIALGLVLILLIAGCVRPPPRYVCLAVMTPAGAALYCQPIPETPGEPPEPDVPP